MSTPADLAWIPARIIRASGRNAFVVILLRDDACTICEIHCLSLDAGDRREFNKAVRKLLSPITSVVDEDKDILPLSVDVSLGNYNTTLKCWTHCLLRYT